MTLLLAALALLTAALPGAAAAQGAPAPAPARSPFLPDTVLAPPVGPRVVLLSAPGDGVAALRLFVPLREGPTEAGSGTILRDMALGRMESLARPVGARVSAARTPWGIAYAVEGAVADFEYLAYLLREGVAEPDVASPAFQEARSRLSEVVARTRETPAGRLAADLRTAVAPALLPTWGTPGAEPPDAARVREVWQRSHQSSAMTLVVSAPVVPEVVLAATRGLGAPESAAAGPLDAPARPPGRQPAVDAIHRWYGEAWQGGSPADPHGEVVALLVAETLRRAAGDGAWEAGVELWELPDRWVLALSGSAMERRAAAMRTGVGGALASTRNALDATSVARAAARVRRDVLLQARTSAGLVSVVGRAMELSGDPSAAATRIDALGRIEVGSTARYIDEMIRRGPVRAEVRP